MGQGEQNEGGGGGGGGGGEEFTGSLWRMENHQKVPALGLEDQNSNWQQQCADTSH